MLEAINPQATAYTLSEARDQGSRFSAVASNSEHEETVSNDRQVRTAPGQDEVGADGRKRDTFELSQEAEEIRLLQARDREVRAHEAAHAAAGGSYAGSPSYTFERGPDGQSYAVGGEVGIDVSPVAGDPQATIQKAQQVRTAALAPMQPSSQDMRVAQRAQAMEAQARQELSSEMAAEMENMLASQSEKTADGMEANDEVSVAVENSTNSTAPVSGYARLSIQA